MKLDRRILIAVSLVLIATHSSPVLAQIARTATTPATAPAAAVVSQSDSLRAARYRVQRSDVLELNFPFVPDFNQTVAVRPDGFVTLRVIGALRVEGMTVSELTDRLRTEYRQILRNPVITVELKEFEKPYFIVAGAVEGPGKYDLRGDMTVTEGVAMARGLTRGAHHSRAVVFRRLPTGDMETTRIDLKKMLSEADLGTDMHLQSGDVLFIPGGRDGVRASEVFSSIGIVFSSVWILRNL
jgi:polysaccharide biosynthesis/export protein